MRLCQAVGKRLWSCQGSHCYQWLDPSTKVRTAAFQQLQTVYAADVLAVTAATILSLSVLSEVARSVSACCVVGSEV